MFYNIIMFYYIIDSFVTIYGQRSFLKDPFGKTK